MKTKATDTSLIETHGYVTARALSTVHRAPKPGHTVEFSKIVQYTASTVLLCIWHQTVLVLLTYAAVSSVVRVRRALDLIGVLLASSGAMNHGCPSRLMKTSQPRWWM